MPWRGPLEPWRLPSRKRTTPGFPTPKVAQFLADAATLEVRYHDMLGKLASTGTKVVQFNKDAAASVRQIETAFSAIRLQVIGPTPRQLELCSDAIAAGARSAADMLGGMAPDVMDLETEPHPADLVNLYRSMLRPSATADFRGDAFQRRGMGAKNDQSIVLSLAGDESGPHCSPATCSSPSRRSMDSMISSAACCGRLTSRALLILSRRHTTRATTDWTTTSAGSGRIRTCLPIPAAAATRTIRTRQR